jgi:hypothetical protein
MPTPHCSCRNRTSILSENNNRVRLPVLQRDSASKRLRTFKEIVKLSLNVHRPSFKICQMIGLKWFSICVSSNIRELNKYKSPHFVEF